MDQLLIALVGQEKSGKSRLAATARKPILFFDWDGRAASLSGRKGVFAVSFVDNTGYLQPDAFNTYLQIMTQLEQNNFDLGCVSIDGKNFGVPQGTIIQTIVHDSITRMSRAVMRYILSNAAQNKGMARQVRVGALAINFPGSFEAWNAEMVAIEDALLRTFASKKDVIAIFHESPEEDPASTAESPIYTGRVGVFPVRHTRMLGYFNEVWRVTRGQGTGTAQSAVPIVQTCPDYSFKLAASALDIQANEVPDIEAMINEHRSKHGGKLTPVTQAPALSVAKPIQDPKGPRMITGADPAVVAK